MIQVTTSFIIKKASGETTKMDETALWLWGIVREFERRGVADKHPAYLLSEMTDTQIADMRRIAGIVGEYLIQIAEHADWIE